ncbi:hypothetical protein [Gracilibacillus boraciitolerans]
MEHRRVVLMCSERHSSRCHRLLISNHLVAIRVSILS